MRTLAQPVAKLPHWKGGGSSSSGGRSSTSRATYPVVLHHVLPGHGLEFTRVDEGAQEEVHLEYASLPGLVDESRSHRLCVLVGRPSLWVLSELATRDERDVLWQGVGVLERDRPRVVCHGRSRRCIILALLV